MWFVLSWLVACETTVPTVEVKEAVGAVDAVAPAPAENGRLTIASAPDRRGPLAPKVRSAPIPSGEVIVRDCYGDAERANNRPRPPQASRAPLPPKSAAAPKPAPSPAPTPALPAAPAAEVASNGPGADKDSSGAMAPSAGLGNTGGGKGGGGAKQDPAGRRAQEAAPVDLAAAAPAAPAAAPAAVSAEPHRGSAPQAEPPTPPPPQDLQGDALADGSVVGGVIETKKKAEKPRSDTDRETADEEATERARPREPVLDWGATVYLSNDDSMSLASAQRMLFSWMNGKHVTPAEVRPHELLNYFSFDVPEVRDGQLFSVLGAAEQQGDQLTVALAVRGASPERDPLDLTVVVDRSGSMSAEGRMDYTRRGLLEMTEQLKAGDRVDLVLFDSEVCTPLEGFVSGRDDPALLTDAINRMAPRSATDLDGGLREGYRIQQSRSDTAGRNRRILLVTDAMLNSGNVNADLVSEIGRRFDEDDIRLTGVGVGREFNDKVLDQLTEKGKGAYVYLGSEAVVDRVFGAIGFDSLTRTIAHDVQFSLDLPPSLAMKRFYGEEASTNPEDVQPINYYASTTQLFLQDLSVRDGRVVESDPVVMRIRYTDAHTGQLAEQVLHTTVGGLLEGDPHNVRKGKALMAFADVVTAEAMYADPCGAPTSLLRERLSDLSDDAEMGFIAGLVGSRCGVNLTTAPVKGVAYKVKLDSDIPIAEVGLMCAGNLQTQAVGAADSVARFSVTQTGSCTLKLQGQVEMTAAVDVPATGGDIKCLLRGGRLACG